MPKSSVAALLRTCRGTFLSAQGPGRCVVDPRRAAVAAEFATSRQGWSIGPRRLMSAASRSLA